MSMQAPTAPASKSAHDELLLPVAEYWMKTRIDAPLQAITRLDENAKQLIVIAAALQGLLTAVLKLDRETLDPEMFYWAVAGFSTLFLTVGFAALALVSQVKYLGLTPITKLLTPSCSDMVTTLGEQVRLMCVQVDRVLARKRILIAISMSMFALSFIASIGCLAQRVDW